MAKFFGSTLLQPACSICVSLSAFFSFPLFLLVKFHSHVTQLLTQQLSTIPLKLNLESDGKKRMIDIVGYVMEGKNK